MIRNYFKTAWRNLLKNKSFSAINIVGLALGIAAFLLILNYLRFEYSYDDYHINGNRIYRIPMEIRETGQSTAKTQLFAFTYPAVAPALKKDYPEIEEAVRFRKAWGVVRYANNKFVEDGFFYFVDPAVFRVFSFEFEKGDPKKALDGLNDAVITKSTARKYFGASDPIGKTLLYDHDNYVVRAVIRDLPANSHLNFHILCNFSKYVQKVRAFGADAQGSWGWSDFYTYILLRPGSDIQNLNAKMPGFAKKYMDDQMKSRGFVVAFRPQPLKDIHLRSKYDYELSGNGNLTYLKYLGLAAFFILAIAWINYINLSTARAIDRAKEVGIRKVIGAGRFQLLRQFLMESLFVNLLATLLGLAIYFLCLSSFSKLVALDRSSLMIEAWPFWGIVTGIFLLGSFFAGAYPALVLSSFKPLETLKPSGKNQSIAGNKIFLRRSLVVLQFFAAIVLISGAIGFYRQLNFMSHAALGLNIRQTLVLHQTIDQDSSKTRVLSAFVHELHGIPGVESVTLSTSVPGSEIGGSSNYTAGHSSNEKLCRNLGIDREFISDYGLTMLVGRNFTTDQAGMETNVILNETAVRVFGFRSNGDAVGQEIKDRNNTAYRIIGVVRDYHQESLQNSFDPIVFYPEQEYNMSNFSIKINTTNPQNLLASIAEKWLLAFPESPFVYNFLDDTFNAQYKNDRLFSTVLWLFTLLAIVVASLGLLGLSIYTVGKRRKEISIRKVLGASAIQITGMISRDYIRLIMFSALPAIPVSYIILQNWLNDYAFHISIGAWFIIAPILLILTIAMSTVFYHSLRAGLSNPARYLRAE